MIVLALQDRAPTLPAVSSCSWPRKPALELKEWITTDAQGLDTRVELTEVNKAEDLDPGLFKPANQIVPEAATVVASPSLLWLFGIRQT